MLLLRRLPLRCSPIEGESLGSFLARLAQRNGIDKSATLVGQIFGRPSLRALLPDDIARLSDAADLSQERIRQSFPISSFSKIYPETEVAHLMGQELLLPHLLYPGHRRICPACLVDADHDRASWSVRAITACQQHKLTLVSQCKCGRRITHELSSIGRCACGRELSTLAAHLSRESVLASSAYLENRLLTDGGAAVSRLAGMTMADAIEVLRWLGRPGIQTRSRSHRRQDADLCLARGFKLAGLPDAEFFAVIRRLAQRVEFRKGRKVTGGKVPVRMRAVVAIVLEAAAAT